MARRIREIRTERGETQEEFARRAQGWGLEWTRDTVRHLEDGSRALTLEEFFRLPLVLKEELPDLLPARQMVELGPGTAAPWATLVKMLGGAALSVEARDLEIPATRAIRAFRDRVAEEAALYSRLLPKRTTMRELEAIERDATGIAERKAAARFAIDPRHLAIAAYSLWGRSLTAERDARVHERACDEEPRTVQAVRGHVTRELLRELEPVIESKIKRGGDR